MYAADEWTTMDSCKDDTTICPDTHVCADHMWAYNGQHEAATGCWEAAVCSGNGAFWMFDERAIQWFCDEDQTAAADGLDAPYGLTAADEVHFDAFAESCTSDADCEGETQQCTKILWAGTDDMLSFGSGSACYNWDEPACPSDEEMWAQQNMNYEGTGFSYYTQYACAGEFAMNMAVSFAASSALVLVTIFGLILIFYSRISGNSNFFQYYLSLYNFHNSH
jgi:hypothetical protein